MTDDRLMNSVLDGRKRVRDIESRMIKIGKLKADDATVKR